MIDLKKTFGQENIGISLSKNLFRDALIMTSEPFSFESKRVLVDKKSRFGCRLDHLTCRMHWDNAGDCVHKRIRLPADYKEKRVQIVINTSHDHFYLIDKCSCGPCP